MPPSAEPDAVLAADAAAEARAAIVDGRATLGIELGSTRIKLCLIGDDPATVIATGGHDWENRFENRMFTYSLDAVWQGIRAAHADLVNDAERRYGVRPEAYGAIGVSAMMHGYLAFGADDELLVPFRTWRNTTTGVAAAELTQVFGVNIPLRWSIAHLHQAVLDGEPHVPEVRTLTTLAGYVHWRLTGRRVLGVGDASGMFPIDPATKTYHAELLARYDALLAEKAAVTGIAAGGSAVSEPASPGRSQGHGLGPGIRLVDLLPEVLVAGEDAGRLTAEGAALLDPSGSLQPGARLCPPEGDAGTGMVATNAIAPRTGNVSAGTSIFAMVVLEHPLHGLHHELDLVTTPAGDLVAMVHSNNGASELGEWAGLFARFASVAGVPVSTDAAFEALFAEALAADADAGGLLAYNHLAGEPIAGLAEGRPLFVRTPESSFTLANFMRAQLYGVFGTLALGMQVLAGEGVELDRMFAHGGLFRTAGVAQRFLAAALDAPVSVGETASEGGAWGIAVLASYLTAQTGRGPDARADRAAGPGAEPVAGSIAEPSADLATYLRERVFDRALVATVEPDAADAAGFAAYLDRYRAGLAIERAAVAALSPEGPTP